MNRFIAIHPDRCIGCGTCRAACSEAHLSVGLQAEPRLSLVMTRQVSAVVTCHHCQGAPCAQVCPVAAITREDGAVVVNEQVCIGCKLCAIVCPFGAIHPAGTPLSGVAGTATPTPTYSATLSTLLRWDVGVYTRAVKCDLCRLNAQGPQCVASCLTEALEYVTPQRATYQTKQKQIRAVAQNDVMAAQLATIRRKA